MAGASAIWTRKIFFPSMALMLWVGTLRAREWKLSRMSPIDG